MKLSEYTWDDPFLIFCDEIKAICLTYPHDDANLGISVIGLDIMAFVREIKKCDDDVVLALIKELKKK